MERTHWQVRELRGSLKHEALRVSEMAELLVRKNTVTPVAVWRLLARALHEGDRPLMETWMDRNTGRDRNPGNDPNVPADDRGREAQDRPKPSAKRGGAESPVDSIHVDAPKQQDNARGHRTGRTDNS